MKKEFNINQKKRVPPTEEKERYEKKPRIVPKFEALARIAAMKLQREKELSTTDLVSGGLNITVTPKIKGWVDKKDHSKERSGRTELERRSCYRRENKNENLTVQAKLCLGK